MIAWLADWLVKTLHLGPDIETSEVTVDVANELDRVVEANKEERLALRRDLGLNEQRATPATALRAARRRRADA